MCARLFTDQAAFSSSTYRTIPTPMAELYQPSPQTRGGTTMGIMKQNNSFNSEKYL
jgi:hypothetical protein